MVFIPADIENNNEFSLWAFGIPIEEMRSLQMTELPNYWNAIHGRTYRIEMSDKRQDDINAMHLIWKLQKKTYRDTHEPNHNSGR